MASVIVLNSNSRCSASGFCESKAGAMTVATGAAVFQIDLALRLAFFVAFTLWWRRPGAASHVTSDLVTNVTSDLVTDGIWHEHLLEAGLVKLKKS